MLCSRSATKCIAGSQGSHERAGAATLHEEEGIRAAAERGGGGGGGGCDPARPTSSNCAGRNSIGELLPLLLLKQGEGRGRMKDRFHPKEKILVAR